MKNKHSSLSSKNTLELHYWFADESHTMDAFVHNKCEYELLSILKEISKIFECEIIVETEPLSEGGLRRWFKVLAKKENKSGTITAAIIVAIATSVLITPIGKLAEKGIDELFKDEEIIKLQKEKTKEEIESIRLENELKRQTIEKNNVINKRKSNFYEALDSLPKIKQVSFIIENKDKEYVSEEVFIKRSKFKEFISFTEQLAPQYIEDAIIEIISPVLKKGVYKWRGIYNGDSILFSMKSNEFKTLIQTGGIEFKNGSSIKCFLEIESKIDNNGETQITSYNILRVNEYFENDKPIETFEGKKHRQKLEGEKQQLKISFSE